MYLEFAKKLKNGVRYGELSPENRELFFELESLKVLKKSSQNSYLKDEYEIGTIDIARSNTGYLLIENFNDKDPIIEQRDLRGARKDDIVLAKIRANKHSRKKAVVIKILEKSKNEAICYLKKIRGKIRGVEIRSEEIVDIEISQKELTKLPPRCVIVLHQNRDKIVEILGLLDDPFVDEKISLALYRKRDEFAKTSELEALAYGDRVYKELYSDRVDLSALPFCTIDPSDAKDHDDAIYFDLENYNLYVAIADVSEYVTYKSSIDKEALQRGFSIYLPHKSIPMLPRNLSENICSLKEGEIRCAFVFRLKLHKETLEVLEEELFEALIESKKSFSYDEIDTQLNSKIYQEGFEYIDELYNLTKKLRAKRLKKGFDFFSSSNRLILDKNNNLISVESEVETPSHSLIEECMLLANVASSKRVKKSIYRVHKEPDYKKIDLLLDDLCIIGINIKRENNFHKLIELIQAEAEKLDIRDSVDRLIIKSLSQAEYSSNNIGHFGLGFESYSHFTSPIRRYSDLLLHRILKATIKNNKSSQFYQKDIEDIAKMVSRLERESAKVEFDFKDRKYARWANKHIGVVLDAIVVDCNRPPIVKIESEIRGARVFLQDRVEVENLQKLRVKIVSSNIATTRIEAVVVS